METDLDPGYHERFTGIMWTTVRILYHWSYLARQSVRCISTTAAIILREIHPGEIYITDVIKRNVKPPARATVTSVITEIGGTIGDIESAPAYGSHPTAEMAGQERKQCTFNGAYLKAGGELKTKLHPALRRSRRWWYSARCSDSPH